MAYLQKKFQDCGLIFPLILRPKPPNFGGQIFSKSKASFSGPSLLQKPLIQCGLSAEKNPRLWPHFSPHSPAKTPEFRGPLFRIFSVWPIYRKIPSLWIHFCPHSAAKKPEYLYPSNRKTVAVFLSDTFSSQFVFSFCLKIKIMHNFNTFLKLFIDMIVVS